MTSPQANNIGTGIVVAILAIPLAWSIFAMANSGVFGALATSVAHHAEAIQQDRAESDRISQKFRSENYGLMCPDYFKASWISKHTSYRSFAWCEEYADRMPASN